MVRFVVPLLMLLVFTVAVLIGCSDEAETPATETTEVLLSANLAGAERSSEPKVFEGESLYEHINGGAEQYHLYDFVEVTTAYYKRGDVEVSADVYEFSNADNAFGLYSSLRPEDAEHTSLGVEGFVSTGSTVFVKGPYMVKLTGFDESAATATLIDSLAAALDSKLPGTTDLPETFALFPGMFSVEHSEGIIAESYMGQSFLTDVYFQDFALDEDTLRLILTEDKSGAKFLQWSGALEIDSATIGSLRSFPFDDNKLFAFDNKYYGKVVAGLRGGYLVGMVNFTDSHSDFFYAWLDEIPVE